MYVYAKDKAIGRLKETLIRSRRLNNVSPTDDDEASIASDDVPYSEQATNEHNDDKPGTRELTDAHDTSQASLGSNCSSVLAPAEEENPENTNAHNQ